MHMWNAWKHHVCAVGLLLVVGSLSLIGMRIDPKVWGMLGTRAFGYGSLVLVGGALMIGPLARLWPRRLSLLLPYRRAVGIWSAIAGVAHLLFVLEYVGSSWQKRTMVTLFFKKVFGWDEQLKEVYPTYHLMIEDNLTAVAWIGLIALLLLVGVALVSNDRVQRFLGNSAWKLVQQQAYTAFLFVALHVLLMRYGGKLKGSPGLLFWAPWFLLAVALLQIAGFCYTVWKHRVTGSGKSRRSA